MKRRPFLQRTGRPSYLTYFLLNERSAVAVLKAKTVVSTKGQVILPKSIRDSLHWEAGTQLMVASTPDGVLLTAAPSFAPTRPADVFGCLPHKGRPKTLAEMDAGIAAEAKRRYARD